ncbi:MAG: bifunctional folylpolyglutamate synthase/dihydrofolate synthase [Candidatus Omnitrophica bacterium]|nr:bifunctional folylpolyglutamate synthase/dihydrofolate synthase [Candidatus Omnitrophota bacterium]
MHYFVALQYLYSFLDFEQLPFEYKRQFNLARMVRLLDWFSHPEHAFSSIHIAGTKGKGSTANFIASILTANSYRVGLYTSPHLSDPRERIRINGVAISQNDFAELVSKIKPVLERKRKRIKPLEPITFFEVLTLVATLYFKERKVDFGIFEVGMGGRLDATNVLKPLVSVITPISYDHEEHLGHTLTSIAREKAAIIKPNANVVVGKQKPEARQVILKRIQKQKAKGHFFGSTFKTQKESISLKGGRFDFQIGSEKRGDFKISMLGRFQIQNAACALQAVSLLENQFGFSLDERKVRRGLLQAFWPARFEVVKRGALTFVIDAAHNGASMEEASDALRALFPGKEKIILLGTSREKALLPILTSVLEEASKIVVTKSNNVRAQEPKVILETLSKMGYKKPTFWSSDLKEALRLAREAASRNSVIFIAGSIFLAGEAREILGCPKFI